jgi:hypothetical protein
MPPTSRTAARTSALNVECRVSKAGDGFSRPRACRTAAFRLPSVCLDGSRRDQRFKSSIWRPGCVSFDPKRSQPLYRTPVQSPASAALLLACHIFNNTCRRFTLFLKKPFAFPL